MEVMACDSTCNCPNEYDPVCIITAFGDVIRFPNSCQAICAGYTDFIPCSNVNSHPIETSNLLVNPNPVSGEFRLLTDLPTDDVIDYFILDIHGRVVLSQTLRERNVQFDSVTLTPGVYFAVAQNRHGRQTARFTMH